MSKALTLSLIFKANSLNYGEGIANISELKKSIEVTATY